MRRKLSEKKSLGDGGGSEEVGNRVEWGEGGFRASDGWRRKVRVVPIRK